ncbi:RNA-binding S4 domain-containing protein [Betaproteobacteria bacterium SCN2]|jgi:ribosome-associated heat shock protein Hsp15|nr:RNA-binding S4 domain-containing protein [Betaproteobacteria bacterium SCN2]
MRLDKWLWAARFFKTRSLAAQAVDSGKVHWNGERCKPAREIRVNDNLRVRAGETEWEIIVRGLSDRRGPASVAQTLYEETAASKTRREEQAARRRLAREPAHDIKGRPTKRDRRQLASWQAGE